MTHPSQIEALLKKAFAAPKLNRWGKQVRTLAAQATGGGASAYFFEFEALLRIAQVIVACSKSKWEAVAPKNSPCLLWPLAPDVPKDYSYFSGKINRKRFTIRPGVRARLGTHDCYFAPDISLRHAVRGNPIDAPVVRAWDAKYRAKPKDPIARDELCTFALLQSKLVDASKTSWWPTYVGTRVPKHPFEKVLSYSGLLTNGRHSTEPITFVEELGICETDAFGTPTQSTR